MRLVYALPLFIWSALASTQEIRTATPGTPPPTASIADLGWMIGHWEGEGLGGQTFETISPPVAGQMSGHFQQVNDGKLRFYELYAFVPVGNSLMLRLKHFNADFGGWEEKDKTVDFPLVAIEKAAVYFDGVTMRRIGADQMETKVLVSDKGKESVATFRFRRVKL